VFAAGPLHSPAVGERSSSSAGRPDGPRAGEPVTALHAKEISGYASCTAIYSGSLRIGFSVFRSRPSFLEVRFEIGHFLIDIACQFRAASTKPIDKEWYAQQVNHRGIDQNCRALSLGAPRSP